MWAIGNLTNSYYLIAQTNLHTYRAPRKDVLKFLKKNPEVLFELTKRILIGLDGILSNIEYMLCGNAYSRVTGALYLCAKRFGERVQNGKITLTLPLTHQDIANIAGISRETTSLSIKKLEKKRIISCKKKHLCDRGYEKFRKRNLYRKVRKTRSILRLN